MWISLLPLVIGSSLLPFPVLMTTLLLHGDGGTRRTLSFVSGMTLVRVLQGVVFGLLIAPSSLRSESTQHSGHGPVTSAALLIAAVLLLVGSIRVLLVGDDGESPQTWLAGAGHMGSGMAFAFGAGLVALSFKFWVFTLTAISVISDANLDLVASGVTFAVFVLLAEWVHITLLAFALVSPGRAEAFLDRFGGWLTSHQNEIIVGFGLVFGTWFLVLALQGFGVF